MISYLIGFLTGLGIGGFVMAIYYIKQIDESEKMARRGLYVGVKENGKKDNRI